jgi:hypothetical protein
MWSARALCAIGVAYAVTMVVGFAAMGDFSKPLEDPYLAVMEVLILVMARRSWCCWPWSFMPVRRRH